MSYFSTVFPASATASRDSNSGKRKGCNRFKRKFQRKRCRRRRRGSNT
jgi:hypothetical protein